MTQLYLQAHPFYDAAGLAPCKVEMPSGLTITQMLDKILPAAERSESLAVTIRHKGRSHDLAAEMWGRVRPREGTEIIVTRMPDGSGAMRSIGMIAGMALAWWVAPYAAGAINITSAAGIQAVGAGLTILSPALEGCFR